MINKRKIRVLGDIHCKYKQYLEIIKTSKYSVQLGDFGFDYSILEEVDSQCHKLLPGNHENYDQVLQLSHSLGDFGYYNLNGISFFFVRGSISIDKKPRLDFEANYGLKTWWENEELTQQESLKCLSWYKKIKPDLVLSHDCPIEVKDKLGVSEDLIRNFGFPAGFCCSTQRLLQQMLEIHRPKLWIFGHWHRNRDIQVGPTRFICVDELSYVDVTEDLKVIFPRNKS